MISHSSVKIAGATAIAADENVKEFCMDNFGRAPLVIVDWYGAEGSPTVKDVPWIFVYSAGAENDIGFVDSETFQVSVVCGAKDEGFEPSRRTLAERTTSQSGLVVNGIADKLEELRTLVEIAIENADVGATVQTITRSESSTVSYPLEWAKMVIDFYEAETL